MDKPSDESLSPQEALEADEQYNDPFTDDPLQYVSEPFDGMLYTGNDEFNPNTSPNLDGSSSLWNFEGGVENPNAPFNSIAQFSTCKRALVDEYNFGIAPSALSIGNGQDYNKGASSLGHAQASDPREEVDCAGPSSPKFPEFSTRGKRQWSLGSDASLDSTPPLPKRKKCSYADPAGDSSPALGDSTCLGSRHKRRRIAEHTNSSPNPASIPSGSHIKREADLSNPNNPYRYLDCNELRQEMKKMLISKARNGDGMIPGEEWDIKLFGGTYTVLCSADEKFVFQWYAKQFEA